MHSPRVQAQDAAGCACLASGPAACPKRFVGTPSQHCLSSQDPRPIVLQLLRVACMSL